MKISLVFVNYNNCSFTLDLIKSIENNCKNYKYNIIIVDNNSSEHAISTLRKVVSEFVQILYLNHNIGYFGALNYGLKYLYKHNIKSDFIIVGNNDLEFNSDFFHKLEKNLIFLQEKFVISPAIIDFNGSHQNPLVFRRISRIREIIWDIYYSSYFIAGVISVLNKLFNKYTKRNDTKYSSYEGYVYQGYGAIYILTKKFVDGFQLLFNPTFLMGEEFHLSKQLEYLDQKVYYYPKIYVKHHDHASCNLLPRKKMWRISANSHKVYRFFVSPYKPIMKKSYTYKDYSKLQ